MSNVIFSDFDKMISVDTEGNISIHNPSDETIVFNNVPDETHLPIETFRVNSGVVSVSGEIHSSSQKACLELVFYDDNCVSVGSTIPIKEDIYKNILVPFGATSLGLVLKYSKKLNENYSVWLRDLSIST